MNLKVLMIFYDLDARAGIQRAICQLTNGFVKRGVCVDICLARQPSPAAFDIADSVRYIVFPLEEPKGNFAKRAFGKLLWALKFNRFIVTHLNSSNYDVIVDHGTAWGLWYGKFRIKNIPVILCRHFSIKKFPLSRIVYCLIKLLGSHRNVVVLTNTAKQELEEFGFNGNISIIPNFTAISSNLLNTDCTKDRIISIGRGSHQKGFDILLKAYLGNNIYQKYGVPLYIYGASIPLCCNKILQSIKPGIQPEKHGLFFSESTSNIINEFKKANFLVSSSRYEGFSFVCLEALALGLPVICTDIDGPNQLVVHEYNGLIVKPEDPVALGSAISRLLSDRSLLSRLTQSCVTSVSAYSEEAVIEKWFSYFKQIIAL